MELKGLIIRAPYVHWILDGLKTWEMRGSSTKVRGPIALIEGGSGTVVGACDLIEVVGPLTVAELRANAKKLNHEPSEITGPLYYGNHTYAWVLSNAVRLKKPVPYAHPSGAVIWVKLGEDVGRRINGQRPRSTKPS